MSDQSAQHVIITGEVQGVGYRYFTFSAARRLGIVGNVRNLADGRVEVFAQGRDVNLDAFLQELRKGPSHAIVEKVECVPASVNAALKKFDIVRGRHAATH